MCRARSPEDATLKLMEKLGSEKREVAVRQEPALGSLREEGAEARTPGAERGGRLRIPTSI